jgi:hypothetical protein
MITPRNMERVDEADEELHDGNRQGDEEEKEAAE